ncbi:hypothetical protein ACF0H5_009264 [Mactra antiquata]
MEEKNEANNDNETIIKSNDGSMDGHTVYVSSRKRKIKDYSDDETDSRSGDQSLASLIEDGQLRVKSSRIESSEDGNVFEEFDESKTNNSSGNGKETDHDKGVDASTAEVSDIDDAVRLKMSEDNCNERKMEVRFQTYGNDIPINVNITSTHPMIKIISARVTPHFESGIQAKISIGEPTCNMKSEVNHDSYDKPTNKHSYKPQLNDMKNDAPKSSNITYDYNTLQSLIESCLNESPYPGSKVKCKICNKSLRDWKSLQRHLLTIHLDSNEKKFICYICDPPFYMKSNLKTHLKAHKDYKPFHCKICSKTFRQVSHVKEHLRSHSGSSEYQCPLCIQTFKGESNLLHHAARHCRVSPLECPMATCVLKFATIYLLNIHLRQCMENDKDSFQCKLCLRVFNDRDKIISHMKTHENDEIYDCQICHENFSSYKRFVRHKIELNHFTDDERDGATKTLHSRQFYKYTPTHTNMAMEELLNMYEYVGQHDIGISENKEHSGGMYFVHENVDDRNYAYLTDTPNEEEIESVIKVEAVLDDFSPDQIDDRNSCNTNDDEVVAVLQQSNDCSWSEIPVSAESHSETNLDNNENTIVVTISDEMNVSEMASQEVVSKIAAKEVISQSVPFNNELAESLSYRTRSKNKRKSFNYNYKDVTDISEDINVKEWFNFSNLQNVIFKCLFEQSCSFTSNSYTKWCHHFRSVHSEKKRNGNLLIYCCQCQYTPHEKRLLKKHVQMKHSDTSICPIGLQHCGITSETTGQSLNLIACIFCGFLMDEDNFEQLHECKRIPFCFYCPLCDYKEVVFDVMCSHIQSCHNGEIVQELSSQNKNTRTSEKDLASRIDEHETECVKCDSKFYTNTELKLHMNKVHELYPFSCGVCRLCYGRFDSLRDHMQKIHPASLVCKHCQRRFGCKRDLERHKATHSNIKPFKCEHCDKSYADVGALHVHIGIKHPNVGNDRKLSINNDEPTSYMCHLCGENLQTKVSLDLHQKQVHALNESEDTDLLTCSVCSKTFTNKHSYNCHSCDINNDAPSSSIITYNYNTLQMVSEMWLNETLDSESKVKCKICNKSFRTVHNLRRHLFTKHLDDSEKKYICNICDQPFFSQSDLKRHLKVHKDSRPFRCKICSKTFRQVSHVKEHLLLHANTREYQCPLCVLAFKCEPNLLHHVARHCSVNPFECPIATCVSKFSTIYLLNTHLKQCKEDDQDGLECKFCQQAFNGKHEVISHMKTHENDYNYDCQICNENFSSYKKFVRHKTELNHFTDTERHKASKTTCNRQYFKYTSPDSDLPIEELLTMYEYVNAEKTSDYSGDMNIVQQNVNNHNALDYNYLAHIQNEGEIENVVKVEAVMEDFSPDQIDDRNSCDTNDHNTVTHEVNSEITPQDVISEMPQEPISNTISQEPISVNNCQVIYQDNITTSCSGTELTTVDNVVNITEQKLESQDSNRDIEIKESERSGKTIMSAVKMIQEGEKVYILNQDNSSAVGDENPLNFSLPFSTDGKYSIQNVGTSSDCPREKKFDMSTSIGRQSEYVQGEFPNGKETQPGTREIILETENPYTCINNEVKTVQNEIPTMLAETNMNVDKVQGFLTDTEAGISYQKIDENNTNYKVRLCYYDDRSKRIDEYPFKCDICDKRYKRRESLNSHKKTHLPNEERSFHCLKCGKGFNFRHGLRVHERIHSDVKPYKCTKCDKSFRQLGHLQVHLRLHADYRPFQCAVCDKKFISNCNLRKHVISRHNSTGEQFECDKCPSSFNSIEKLRYHKISHLDKTLKSELISKFSNVRPEDQSQGDSVTKRKRRKDKPVMCDICGKVTTHIKNHKSSHETNSIPCPHCQKVFASRLKLRNHLSRTHTTKYLCDICGLELKSYQTAVKHSKTHTGDIYNCSNCNNTFTFQYEFFKHLVTCVGDNFIAEFDKLSN